MHVATLNVVKLNFIIYFLIFHKVIYLHIWIIQQKLSITGFFFLIHNFVYEDIYLLSYIKLLYALCIHKDLKRSFILSQRKVQNNFRLIYWCGQKNTLSRFFVKFNRIWEIMRIHLWMHIDMHLPKKKSNSLISLSCEFVEWK